MSRPIAAFACVVLMTLLSGLPSSAATRRWSIEQIDAWYADQRWLVGATYVPANAINQLEMWQAEVDPIRSAAMEAQAELDARSEQRRKTR